MLYEVITLALGEEMKYDVYRVEKILFGLGFDQEDLDKAPGSFSGGYQIRINLAKLLVTEPNLLLLDEPTNYLDILSLRWLRTFLRAFQGEVILITHDRDFMDSITVITSYSIHYTKLYDVAHAHFAHHALQHTEVAQVGVEAGYQVDLAVAADFIAGVGIGEGLAEAFEHVVPTGHMAADEARSMCVGNRHFLRYVTA